MTVSVKSAGTSVCVTVSVLCLLFMAYQSPTMQSVTTTLTSQADRLKHPHESNPLLDLKSDRPVLYLSDHNAKSRAKLLTNVSSPRVRLKSFAPSMLKAKLRDDYLVCNNEASFVGPYNYLANSKNPCWRPDQGSVKCVPYFYLAGFSKCGTTDLYFRMTAHPEIAQISRKEKHWFDYRRYFPMGDAISSYTKLFSSETRKIEAQIIKNGYSGIVIGDGTPSYVWDSHYWPCYQGNRGLTEPRYTNPDVIHRLNPRAKIIVMLRDPVKRLYSRYLTWINKVNTPSYTDPGPYTFHKISLRAIKMYTKCFSQWSHRHCAYNGTLYAKAELRLQEGLYSVYLRDWLRVFPREQILILKFEDYVVNVTEHLIRIYRFLDVATLPDEMLKAISKLTTKNVGSNYDLGQMLVQTRDALRAFYAPFNKDLQYVLNDNQFAWGYE